jgi:hypothetical protein
MENVNESISAVKHWNATHGMYGTPEYEAWACMKSRCFNKNNNNYQRYGARGITVCQEWVNSFEAFFAYIGRRPSKNHSLERLKNDGNYEPGNVKWGTKEEQDNNRRTNNLLTAFGETMTVARWERRKGLPKGIVWQRLQRGWTAEDALTIKEGTKTRWKDGERLS